MAEQTEINQLIGPLFCHASGRMVNVSLFLFSYLFSALYWTFLEPFFDTFKTFG